MLALRSIAAATLGAFALSTAHAAYLVDTGPGSGTNWALNESQSLGATFSLDSSTLITGVEGWFGGGPGLVLGKLIGGSSPAGSVLHSLLFGATASNTWRGSKTEMWVLAPGDYTLVFSAFDGFNS